MRVTLPTVLGLATLAAADSCVTTYSNCVDAGGADNTCQADNAVCKNVCAANYGDCLHAGLDDAACMVTYNDCYDDFKVFSTAENSAGKDCVSLFSSCHDSGVADNTCNANNAQCKDKCSTIYGTCLTSGQPDNAACSNQYNNCLDAFSVFQTREVSQNIDCVSKFNACHDNGTIPDNECNAENAQCKDKCGVIYGTCLSSGSSDDAKCMAQYNNCYVSFTPSTSLDCVSEFTTCVNTGGAANTCNAGTAQCKDKCSVSYSTCLASGAPDKPACLAQYTGCLVDLDAVVANTTSCSTKYTTCDNDGVTPDNECSAGAATCKGNCAISYDTCLTSGDQTMLAPCLKEYGTCLDDFTAYSKNTTSVDCVTEYLTCDGASNDCGAENAQCKNSCSTVLDICRSSGDNSTTLACQAQYNDCLFDPAVVHTNVDCTTAYFSCNDADNTCQATLATCKNTCSVALDTCNTSGDDSFTVQCSKLYDSCLFNQEAATAAIGADCVGEYLGCQESGTADNVCNANVAQCKNKCAQGYDTCNTSGNNATAPACMRTYDLCLVSFSANETTAAGQDCESLKTACGKAGTPDNECNADYAQCKNKCATVLDTCSSSGNKALHSMCDSLYNGCLSPVNNTDVTTPPVEILKYITFTPDNSTLPVNPYQDPTENKDPNAKDGGDGDDDDTCDA